MVRGIYQKQRIRHGYHWWGRCNLIKGDYYYFTINHKWSGRIPKEGDLLYVVLTGNSAIQGRFPKLAGHFIGFLDVYDQPWYDRYVIFNDWSFATEKALLDSMLVDIHYTGDYFIKEDPSMNKTIIGGRYDGKLVLNKMKESAAQDLTDFLDYILARPRLYAGAQWKIAEVYATWLISGGPMVEKLP